ncbi:MAG: DUF3786 domain-containing protein [Deltaproteobacteria bacterium]|nr:DUF3786 domain-containing protein [Deltaproteobacteria bacterium]MBW2134540.1 DUF3786 domain-containing protein [Deltaproteobacteria bacterium]
MPRIDDYKQSLALAVEELKLAPPQEVAARSQARYEVRGDGQEGLILAYFGRPHWISWPEIKVAYLEEEGEVNIQEQILMLHYLTTTQGKPLTGKSIDFRQVPAGEFYHHAFVQRARVPLLKVFGHDLDLYQKVAEMMGGTRIELGDVAATYQAFPLVPITHVLWKGDDEFQPEVNILYDESIVTHLPTEDIAALSGFSVYRLFGAARKLQT